MQNSCVPEKILAYLFWLVLCLGHGYHGVLFPLLGWLLLVFVVDGKFLQVLFLVAQSSY